MEGFTTKLTAHFSSSGLMVSNPGARPFFRFRMTGVNSSNVGSSTEVNSSVVTSLTRYTRFSISTALTFLPD